MIQMENVLEELIKNEQNKKIKEIADVTYKTLTWVDKTTKKNKILSKCVKRLGIICLCNAISIIGLLILLLVLYL